MTKLRAILAQRCPRCCEGRVFGGFVAMNRKCPNCDVAFEREQGYFLGAMYISYGLAVALVAAPVTLMIIAGSDALLIGAVAGVALLVFAPLIFRYSRVLWLHFDNHFDPM